MKSAVRGEAEAPTREDQWTIPERWTLLLSFTVPGAPHPTQRPGWYLFCNTGGDVKSVISMHRPG